MKNKNIQSQWFISYLCILFLPIIINFSYGYYTLSVIRNNNTVRHKLVSEITCSFMDSIFYDAKIIANTVQYNKYVSAYSKGKTSVGSAAPLDRYEIMKALSVLKAANSSFSQISIYFPQNGYVISTDAICEISMYDYMSYPSYPDISKADWERIVACVSQNPNRVMLMGTTDSVLVIRGLFYDREKLPLSVIAVQMNKESLRERFGASFFYEEDYGFALMYDQEILLASSNYQQFSERLSEENLQKIIVAMETGENGISLREEGVSYQVTYQSSNIYNAGYLTIIETGLQNQFLYSSILVLLLTVLLSVVAGILFTSFFSRNHYKPLQKIMNILDISQNPMANENEYQLIFSHLNSQKKELEKYAESQKNQYINNVLTGEIPITQLNSFISAKYDLPFQNPYCCVILINETFLEEQCPDEDSRALHAFIIENVMHELLNEYAVSCYTYRMSHMITAVAGFQQPLPDSGACMRGEISSRLESFVSQYYHYQPHIGFSSVGETAKIRSFYLEAFETFNGSETALLQDTADLSGEKMLHKASGMEKDAISLERSVHKYVENNYFDPNLNINTIAMQFHISPAYLSKKYKAVYGQGISDFIYEIRIERAKELLTESKLKISEIAQIVGFVDSNALIRIFKKYTGVTPGKYIANIKG